MNVEHHFSLQLSLKESEETINNKKINNISLAEMQQVGSILQSRYQSKFIPLATENQMLSYLHIYKVFQGEILEKSENIIWYSMRIFILQ